MPAAFIPNRDFLKDPVVGTILEETGRNIIELAEEAAPYRTGHLAGSFEGAWVDRGDGTWVYRVAAQDFKAAWKEFGTVRAPGEHFLARATLAVTGNLE